jgi:hypothetical protein
MRATRCPYLYCTNVKKNGKKAGKQRYTCLNCRVHWTGKARPSRLTKKLWKAYAFEGRTASSLAGAYGKSAGWVRARLDAYTPPRIVQKPRTVSVVMDATYFDGWGMLVVIDPTADSTRGENTVLYYAILAGTERTVDYEVATDTIEAMGYSILMATIDGRRGVQHMLEQRGIPVQYCQFHQLMTITQCLTKHPRLPQNIELRAIALTLAQTNEATFEAALAAWYKKHGTWLKERDPITRRWSHERTRRAYFSLARHLPNLFTYQHDYIRAHVATTGKKVANTTSPLDGRFGVWKDKLRPHRGISKQRTITILCSFFSRATD